MSVPDCHWRSYGTDPPPATAEALAEPFSASRQARSRKVKRATHAAERYVTLTGNAIHCHFRTAVTLSVGRWHGMCTTPLCFWKAGRNVSGFVVRRVRCASGLVRLYQSLRPGSAHCGRGRDRRWYRCSNRRCGWRLARRGNWCAGWRRDRCDHRGRDDTAPPARLLCPASRLRVPAELLKAM